MSIVNTSTEVGLRLFAPRLRQAAIPVALYVPLFLIGTAVLWTPLSPISHSAPDKDNIEELVRASSFEWGSSNIHRYCRGSCTPWCCSSANLSG
jgi:hypothetical protein